MRRFAAFLPVWRVRCEGSMWSARVGFCGADQGREGAWLSDKELPRLVPSAGINLIRFYGFDRTDLSLRTVM